jgi:hypothetical protein
MSGLANPQKQRPGFEDDETRRRTRYRSRSWTRSRSRSRAPSPRGAPSPPPPPPPPPAQEIKPSPGVSPIREERLYCLLSLKRMRAEGVEHISNFTMDSNVEDMRLEVKTLSDDQMVTSGIETCRTALISVTTSLEMLNRKFDVFGLDLDGWSQSTYEGIERYDGVLEKLSRKYARRVANMTPKMQLVLMLTFSGAQFCFQKAMIQSAMPSMRKVAEENPELVEKMRQSLRREPKKPKEDDAPGPPPAPPQSSRFDEEEQFAKGASSDGDMSLSIASVSLGMDESMSVGTSMPSPKPVKRVSVVRGGRKVVRKAANLVKIDLDD